MRLLAIGDIHGCLQAFDALLEIVAIQPDDRIVALGDYVDRGSDSHGVIERLLALYDTGRLVPLRGNHEVMMLAARHFTDPMWLACGGESTLWSYGVAPSAFYSTKDLRGLLANVPPRHWQFLDDECAAYYESDRHFFVHACADPNLPLDQQPEDLLYWEKLYEPCRHVSGKIMVCGHTRQKSGWPLDLGTTICIDTNVYDGGWLTCLDVDSRCFWQANEDGETRRGSLDALPDEEE